MARRRAPDGAAAGGLRAAMAAAYRQRAATTEPAHPMRAEWEQLAERWASGAAIEHVYGWQLPDEYRPPGRRDREYTVPAGSDQLIPVVRLHPARSEVRWVPDATA